ncbi:MAG: hypothetical protein P9L99_14880 [Candidatus Lernaella stagnicola]|nr:hypothetical protein [Candidatus Lernaella stagnicola]
MNRNFDFSQLNEFEARVVEAGRIYAKLKLATGCRNINGLPVRRSDPRAHRNWRVFAATVALCDEAAIDVREFLRCVLWRTVDELQRGWEASPSMLPTKWAVDRWKKFRHQLPPDNTLEQFQIDTLAVIRTSRAFLRGRALHLFGEEVSLDYLWGYRESGSGFNLAIRWMASLARPYLALSKAFWKWFETAPATVVEEHVPVQDLKTWRWKLSTDTVFIEKAREIMGEDLWER